MRIPQRLVDKEHPIVRATAYRLIPVLETPRVQLRAFVPELRETSIEDNGERFHGFRKRVVDAQACGSRFAYL